MYQRSVSTLTSVATPLLEIVLLPVDEVFANLIVTPVPCVTVTLLELLIIVKTVPTSKGTVELFATVTLPVRYRCFPESFNCMFPEDVVLCGIVLYPTLYVLDALSSILVDIVSVMNAKFAILFYQIVFLNWYISFL